MENMMTTDTQARGPYLYGKIPFYPGKLYEQLATAQYDFVVGLDFGHGETVAYKYYLEDIMTGGKKPVYRHVQMNYEGSFAIPTYICYDASGQVKIGKEAVGISGFYQHFKRSPKEWSMPVGGREARELMQDFIRTLWQSILVYEKEIKVAAEEGKLLLAVGCPSGTDWTTEEYISEYCKLVQEATGCKHVNIFPESSAAIMSNILSAMTPLREDQTGQKQRRTDRGVAIYDFGSSTLDFTYVLMGVAIFNYSVDLGGAQIDRAMLKKILADNNLTENDIPIDQNASILAQIRTVKETFYKNENLVPQLLSLMEKDETGNSIPEKYAHSVIYNVNDAFMHAVLWEDKKISIHNATYRNRGFSWAECCKQFVTDTCKLISQNPCEAVVVTGGTSFVTDATEICRNTYMQAFPEAAFSAEEDRGASVAKGLCYARSVESRSAQKVETARNSLKKAFTAAYDKLLENVSKCIFDEIWTVSSDVCVKLAQNGQPHHINAINKKITDEIHYNAALKKRIGQAYGMHLRRCLVSCQKIILKEVNDLSKEIYNTQLENLPNLPKITDIDMENIMLNLNVDRLFAVAPLQEIADWIRILLWFPKFLIDKAGMVSHDQLVKLAQDRQNDHKKDRKKRAMVRDIKKDLCKDTDLRTDFDARVNEQFEIALGKIIFMLYDREENT